MDDHDFDDAASILANSGNSPWDESWDDDWEEGELTERAQPTTPGRWEEDDETWDDPEPAEEV